MKVYVARAATLVIEACFIALNVITPLLASVFEGEDELYLYLY